MKKGLAEGLSYTGLQMQDIRRRLLSTEESRDTLRARVAKLEAALRGVLYLAESACARTEVGWIATRSGDDWTDGIRAARAALGAKGEGT